MTSQSIERQTALQSKCTTIVRMGLLLSGLASMSFAGSNDIWFVKKDVSWFRKLSQPQHEIVFEWDRKIKMRDGIKLSANVWRPKTAGKFPVIMMFTPYDNTNQGTNWIANVLSRAKYFVPRGYAFAAVSSRGRYDSEGVSYRYWNPDWRDGKFDGLDIDDSLNWLGSQSWSSGKIAMVGGSYLGFSQWLVAQLGNPYLAAIIPYCSPDDDYDNVFPSGAFRLSAVITNIGVMSGHTNKGDLGSSYWDWNRLYRHLPLRTMDKAMIGRTLQNWQDFMDHPSNTHYWRFSVGERERVGDLKPGKYAQVKVPSLNITGWNDTTLQFSINNFMAMRRYGPKELRNAHHLIVGPWVHSVGARKVGDIDFGPDAEADLYTIELRWYDRWLKGIENSMTAEPPVQLFVTGTNRWRNEREWPLDRERPAKFYFQSGGHANTSSGDGALSMMPPDGVSADSYIYDPEDPTPSYGLNVVRFKREDNEGARDQREIETRRDVLVYSGKPLDDDVEVSGRVLGALYAASSARDTDFMMKLVDVHPDGYALILAEGNIRARYRNSLMTAELLTPGQTYEYKVDLASISHVFKKGHVIRVEVSSSNFPKYDRNPNTGHKFGEDAELMKANQRVFHSKEHASHISLPIIPN